MFRLWLEKRLARDDIKARVPGVRQRTSYSCGAAALRAVAEYYGAGLRGGEEKYRRLLGSDRDRGTDPASIVRVAGLLGLRAASREGMTHAELRSLLDRKIPVICAIQAWGDDFGRDESGHYVVAVGYDDENVYFMEPMIKDDRGYLPTKQFLSRWHDEGADGRPYDRLGIVVLGGTARPEKEKSKKAKKID